MPTFQYEALDSKGQEIKDQIANGTYNFDDPKMLDMVADKIATFLMRK